jgi:hypothetical protein
MGCCDYDNGFSGFVNGGEFLDQLNGSWFMRKGFTAWWWLLWLVLRAPKNLGDRHCCTGGVLEFNAAMVLHVVESL